MRFHLGSILFLVTLLMMPAAINAQENQSAAQLADELRGQLIEVQTKEDSLRIQDKQLEDDLKPENIERAFAGVGSTKPEDLREQRRRLLTMERDSVRARIKILELSRARLEMAILAAEARAYQESALPTPSPLPPVQVFAGNSATLAIAVSMIPHVFLLIVFMGLMLVRVFFLGRILR